MIERLLENWLDNAAEKSFQVPFCYMLISEGYKIIHISRHCPMEMGKDIIAISPDGNPCAFQLKGGSGKRITLNEWNKHREQIISLIENKIIHPSIAQSKIHDSFFVTNKILDEEVSASIDQMNRMNIDRGRPEFQLKTIVRGEMLEKAKKLESSLWPSELKEINLLLELIIGSGRTNLDKLKYCTLIESVLPIKKTSIPPRNECLRAISACALICSLTMKKYEESKNHVALIESWTIFASYILGMADRARLPRKSWFQFFKIATMSIYLNLGRLCDELSERQNIVEGHPVVDFEFKRIRATSLVGLMSIYGLWLKERNEINEHSKFIRKFTLDNVPNLLLWGEYCIPQLLSFYWYWRTIESGLKPEIFIKSLIDAICVLKNPENENTLPDPYYDYEAIRTSDEMNEYSFKIGSYAIEGLINLYVRMNWKQEMKLIWHRITKLSFLSFKVKRKWHYYLYRNEKGTQITKMPKLTKQWEDLKAEAQESEGKNIPNILKKDPIFHLLLLYSFPFRATAESIRWLDAKLFRT